jgi:serine protease Do
MEKYLADNEVVEALGVTVRDITGPMALIRRYPSSDGVLISGIRPGQPADKAKPKLRTGDVIMELAGQPVKDHAALAAILEEEDGKEDVLIRVRRGEQDVVTVLDLSEPEKPSGGGELPKAWIGIRTQVLTPEVAKALGLGKTRGFRVTQVFRDTMAEEAGVRVGDVLTALNGDALAAWRVQDAEMLTRRVEDLVIGETAKLSILRNGEKVELEVELQETPGTAAEADTAEDRTLEYKVREITFNDLISRRLPMDQKGVLVTEVSPGGWANLAGLSVGDLILRVGGKEVNSIRDFKKAVKSIRKDKPKVVPIFVVRAYKTAFVFIEPDYKD